MNAIKHEYDINDEVYVHLTDGCSRGNVTKITITVMGNEVEETYHVNCTEGTVSADSNHVGFTREDVIDKLIQVQVDSLSILKRFYRKYWPSSYKTGGEITVFTRLHRQGYVIVDEEIKLIHFDKVQYIKCPEGIEVRFYNKEEYYNEVYHTVEEAICVLRKRFVENAEIP